MITPLSPRTLLHDAVLAGVLVWICERWDVPITAETWRTGHLAEAARYPLEPAWGLWHTLVVVSHQLLRAAPQDPESMAALVALLSSTREETTSTREALAVLHAADGTLTLQRVPALPTRELAHAYHAWHVEQRDLGRLTSYGPTSYRSIIFKDPA